MKKPIVSVIMSVYNGERFIIESIKSILNQTIKDLELIIINDNSTDKTSTIINQFMKRDKRIKLINNKVNKGLTRSLNKGLKIAKGKYIARMDSDDISLPNRLKIQSEYLLKSNKNIFLIGSGAININEEGKELNVYHPITDINKIKKILPENNCFYHSTIMFKNIKGIKYREKFKYAQDYDFYLNLITRDKKLLNISNILVKYRVNSNSISSIKRSKQYLFSKKAREFFFERQKYGKDSYDSFNPNKILNLDINKINREDLLKLEISTSFSLADYKKSLKFCKKYISFYGVFNKIGIYFVLNLLGGKSKFFHKLNRILLKFF